MNRAQGEIITVIDITSRDAQDDILFPLTADTTLFTVNNTKYPLRTTPAMQEIGPRGPAAFGQKCVFDLNTSQLPDMIHGVSLQISLDHWFSASIRAKVAGGVYEWSNAGEIWEYANSIGISIIQEATFEVGDTTLDKLTGEYIAVWTATQPALSSQVALAADALGAVPVQRLAAQNPTFFPTEGGIVNCFLPFFFHRDAQKQQQPHKSAFPLVSCKEGSVRIIVTLKSFEQVVRQLRGYRSSCDLTPIGTTQQFNVTADSSNITVAAIEQPPRFKQCSLIVYGNYIDLSQREKYIKMPHEVIYKHLYINNFSEPLTYAIAAAGTRFSESITFQLPLELNGPIEEIFWVLRRKAATVNNDWSTFGPALQWDYDQFGATLPEQFEDPVVEARVLLNGMEAVKKSGYEFRNGEPARSIVQADNWVYSYSWKSAVAPDNGHFNASRIQSIQLSLKVRSTLPLPQYINGDKELNGWEIFVFAHSINWLRFQDGQVGRIFR